MNGKSVYRQVLLLGVFALAAGVVLLWSNRGDQPASPSAVDVPTIAASVLAITGVDTILSRAVDLPPPAPAPSAQ